MAGNPGNTIHLLHPLDGPTNTLISPDENGTGEKVKKNNDKRPVSTRLGRKKNSFLHTSRTGLYSRTKSLAQLNLAAGFAARWLDGCKELDPTPLSVCGVCVQEKWEAGRQRHLASKLPTRYSERTTTIDPSPLRLSNSMPTRSINHTHTHTRRHKKERILDPGNHKSRSSKKQMNSNKKKVDEGRVGGI